MTDRAFGAVDQLIRETAQRIVLPRYKQLGTGDVSEKGPGDYVTIADIEAEAALAEGLTAILPGSQVVGEEAVSKHRDDLSRLTGSGAVWLIDPIDGTVNFVEGVDRFAMMVALVENGSVVAGWIYDPVAGWMARAVAGGGAWCDDRKLSVANRADRVARRGNRQIMRRLGRGSVPDGIETFSYRCAGQEYVALASGDADYGLYTRLMPWDHAAGTLLHHEAGGVGKMIDGTAYDVRTIAGALLLTPDVESWDRLRPLVLPTP